MKRRPKSGDFSHTYDGFDSKVLVVSTPVLLYYTVPEIPAVCTMSLKSGCVFLKFSVGDITGSEL